MLTADPVVFAHSHKPLLQVIRWAFRAPGMMEALLANVAADADLLSISSRTQSSRETIVGLGSLSGKAIQAVGEFALRGVGGVYIRGRLRTIGSQIRSSSGSVPIQVIEDLLELQR